MIFNRVHQFVGARRFRITLPTILALAAVCTIAYESIRPNTADRHASRVKIGMTQEQVLAVMEGPFTQMFFTTGPTFADTNWFFFWHFDDGSVCVKIHGLEGVAEVHVTRSYWIMDFGKKVFGWIGCDWAFFRLCESCMRD